MEKDIEDATVGAAEMPEQTQALNSADSESDCDDMDMVLTGKITEGRKVLRMTCRTCGRIIITTSSNLIYCDGCIKKRRSEQSSFAWKRQQAKKSHKIIEDKKAERIMNNDGKDKLPASYLERAEGALMNRCGIQYAKLQCWKIAYPCTYTDWVAQVRVCYAQRPKDCYSTIIPDGVPDGLKLRKMPPAHSWGGEVHPISDESKVTAHE